MNTFLQRYTDIRCHHLGKNTARIPDIRWTDDWTCACIFEAVLATGSENIYVYVLWTDARVWVIKSFIEATAAAVYRVNC